MGRTLRRHALGNWFGKDVLGWIPGAKLDPHRVAAARREEIDTLHHHQVYVKRSIRECIETTGKLPIGIRWVDINKGDDSDPEYRFRLVAKEIKTGRHAG